MSQNDPVVTCHKRHRPVQNFLPLIIIINYNNICCTYDNFIHT